MTILKIPVERLHEGPLHLDVNVKPTVLDLVDEEFVFKGSVTGHVVFQIVTNDVLATGNLHAQIQTPCVRCLEPTQVPLDVQVNEIWIHSEPDKPVDKELLDDEALTQSYSGDEIELEETFRELIMAELPMRPLCNPDCKGLCPQCGANLNQEPNHSHNTDEAATEPGERQPDWKQKLKGLKLDS